MSITRGIEILNITPSNEAALILALSMRDSEEFFDWKNRTVDEWIYNFIFDKKRRNPEIVSLCVEGCFYYYIIPKNVMKDMAKAINEKDLAVNDYFDSWQEYFEDYESSTLEYLAKWLIKMLDTMNEYQCFCYYDCGD